MMTVTGVRVVPGGTNAPTLYDLGYSLAGSPRFCAATVVPWSVLQHQVSGADYCRAKGYGVAVELHFALHDSHEAITQDVPKPWKTRGLKVYQRELDRRIYRSLGLALPDPTTLKLLKRVDVLMGIAEASLVHPCGTAAVDSEATPDPLAREAVARVLSERFLRPKDAAVTFERYIRKLIGQVNAERKTA